MKLEKLSEPAAEPVLLAEVRHFLKLDHHADDVVLSGLISSARQVCEDFIGRKLIAQTWRWTLNDWPAEDIFLPLSPVISLSEIEVWQEGAFQSVVLDDVLLDQDSFRPRLVPDALIWPEPDRDVNGIHITFVAGYGSDWNAVPHAVRQGILHWIAGAYENRDGLNADSQTMAEKLWQPYRDIKL